MNPDPLLDMLQTLDERQFRYAALDAYYHGRQPLAFLSPEARAAIGDRFSTMVSNLPRLAVSALTERLRVTGFGRDGTPDPELWRAWLANDMDQLAPVAHREALALGVGYVIVWADDRGRPTVSVESARQVATVVDPATRATVAAVKRWETRTETHAVTYGPDEIVHHRAKSTGAMVGFDVIDRVENPLGVVPVVAIANTDRLLGGGTSEIDDLAPLVDALNKCLADMLVSSEFFARPRRWATGIELAEDDEGAEAANPFPEGHRMMVAEPPEAKFGQLPAGDLTGYEGAVNVLLGQIMAVSALPAHYVGVLNDQPASADALRAAEASLAARAAARQATFGRAWEQVARVMHAVTAGVDPTGVEVSVTWADPTTRSIAQEADATVKLHAAGIIPTSTALARLGYTDAEIEQVRSARRAEALDGAGVNLAGLLP